MSQIYVNQVAPANGERTDFRRDVEMLQAEESSETLKRRSCFFSSLRFLQIFKAVE
ncbi:hypothetical protein NQZ68_011175 [Dissostichus eleginoides]|nr:hypothetical protein NQZ68_011175 [Dissostichus eleginoides]